MTTNTPLTVGTLVKAKREGKEIEARIYNVKSEYIDSKDTYNNTYWLRGTVGSFDRVTPI